MQQSADDAIKIATRVLGAITDDRTPDPADIEALKAFVPLVNLPDDELDCEVINQAIKHRGKSGAANG